MPSAAQAARGSIRSERRWNAASPLSAVLPPSITARQSWVAPVVFLFVPPVAVHGGLNCPLLDELWTRPETTSLRRRPVGKRKEVS